MNQEEEAKAFQRIIAKAWMDDEFKGRLTSDPATVLREEGIEVPQGVELKIVENTDEVVHFVLPGKPPGVTIEELDGREAANSMCCLVKCAPYFCSFGCT